MVLSTDSAKQFLLSKLQEQAFRDSIGLSEPEKRMFLFSERSGEIDTEAQEKFDAEYDRDQYEAKIAKLLRRCYVYDKKNTADVETWNKALSALTDDDFYGLVMVDQAGIPRPKSYLSIFKSFTIEDTLFAILELAIVAVAFAPLSDRFRLSIAAPDWLRIVLFAACCWIAWKVSGIWQRRIAMKRADSKLR